MIFVARGSGLVINLGLKSSTDGEQFYDRLIRLREYDTFEFYLSEDDFTNERLILLEERTKLLVNIGVNVIYHQPMRVNGVVLGVAKRFQYSSEVNGFLMETTKILINLCIKYGGKIVVHWNYHDKRDLLVGMTVDEYYNSKEYLLDLRENIEASNIFCNKLGRDFIAMENSISRFSGFDKNGIFVDELSRNADHYLTIDTSHAIITLRGDNDKLIEGMSKLTQITKHYHLVDSLAKSHDGLELGQGVIDWGRVKSTIADNKDFSSIYEVVLDDNNNCIPMLRSHEYLKRAN